MSALSKTALVSVALFALNVCAGNAVCTSMHSNQSAFDTIPAKRQWHTPHEHEAAKLGFRDQRAAALVEENWLRFDGQSYRLLAWIVMPNHVHLLVEIWQIPQSKLIKDWKGFTARRINRLLGRRGKLWQEDYWDRYIRDEKHYRKVRHYIEWNPVKAGLVKWPEQWPFSSARFRDKYNHLKRLPDRGKQSAKSADSYPTCRIIRADRLSALLAIVVSCTWGGARTKFSPGVR